MLTSTIPPFYYLSSGMLTVVTFIPCTCSICLALEWIGRPLPEYK